EDDEEDGEDEEDGMDSQDSEEDVTLKGRQARMNREHIFGMKLWKPALYKKIRSVTRDAETEVHSEPKAGSYVTPVNLIWTLAVGLWFFLLCILLSSLLFLVPWGGRKWARVIRGLAWYILWPFGRFVERVGPSSQRSRGLGDPAYPDPLRDQWDTLARAGMVRDDDGAPGHHPTQGCHEGESTLEVQGEEGARREGDGGREGEGNEESRRLDRRKGPGMRSVYVDLTSSIIYSTLLSLVGFFLLKLLSLSRSLSLSLSLSYHLSLTLHCPLAPILLLISATCFLLVFPVPMAKVTFGLVKHLKDSPLALRFRALDGPPGEALTLTTPAGGESSDRGTILLCTRRAAALKYYKYTVDGTNILFINLMPLVFAVIFCDYIIEPWAHEHGKEFWFTEPLVLFVACLGAVLPLAYFIGMAVSSISAQSSLGMGAVINATFGSIVEIILYCMAVAQGKATLVEGALVGSFLAGLLLMPGLSMLSGGIKRKVQHFNVKSAGVTATTLILAIIGAFTPTLFHQTYGSFELRCEDCPTSLDPMMNSSSILDASSSRPGDGCGRCVYQPVNPEIDPIYQTRTKPLMYLCTIILPLSYLVALLFTLRTHAKHIWQSNPPPPPSSSSSHAPHSQAPHHSVQGAHPQRTSLYRRFVHLVHSLPSNSPNPVASPSTQPSTSHPADPGVSLYALDPSNPASHYPSSRDGRVEGNPRQLEEGSVLYPGGGGGGGGEGGSSMRVRIRGPEEDRIHPPAPSHAPQEHEASSGGGHDAPEWSKAKSAFILLGCTVLFSMIAEVMVDKVDVVIRDIDIEEKFLGLTLFALVPNVTEFMNAISFAIYGNVALSMEIGSAYTVQVAMLQIPSLVAFSIYWNWGGTISPLHTFNLLFPRWDVIVTVLSVFLMTYMYIEGKSTYFKGSILCFAYMVFSASFFFEPVLVASERGGGV
ncbi:MAG: hypothetical protein DHS80DRAFT_14331, partial [Piptocephalis tieghemiana]